MKLETVNFIPDKGWSVNPLPDMDSGKTLIFAFAAPNIIAKPAPLKELGKKYPKSQIIGCSSAGEIFESIVLDNSLVAAFLQFEDTPFQTVKMGIKETAESFSIGVSIADELSKPDLKAILVFSDGLNVNGSELVRGLNESINEGVIITGGLAGDGCRFKNAPIIYNSEILSNHVIAVGLYGDHIQVGHGCRGGWDIFGPERLITRSTNNILYELDNQPALKLYKEYLGDRASGLPATGLLFPLAIRQNDKAEKQLVRTILAVDEKNQSLTFAGDVPVNYRARLMRSNFDRLVSSAEEAGKTAISRLTGDILKNRKPFLSLAVSCVGRKLVLGERTEEEIESVMSSLPSHIRQVGFYSYGEIAPYEIGKCDLHNQTLTLTILYER